MQTTGPTAALAPQVSGHPLGLPESRSERNDTKIASLGADTESSSSRDSSFSEDNGAKAQAKRKDTGDPSAPPTILQLKIDEMLREQREAIERNMPDAAAEDEEPKTNPRDDAADFAEQKLAEQKAFETAARESAAEARAHEKSLESNRADKRAIEKSLGETFEDQRASELKHAAAQASAAPSKTRDPYQTLDGRQASRDTASSMAAAPITPSQIVENASDVATPPMSSITQTDPSEQSISQDNGDHEAA